MDKEDNLFEDLIDEDDDLLNISLDDLSADEIEEPVKEETDEDIIELIDLLEKGEAAFLGVTDDSDSSSDEDLSYEGINEIPDEDSDATPQTELELDGNLIDMDISAHGDDLESDLSDEEFDKLLTEDSLDDLGIENEESEDTVNELENFLNEVEMENPSDDSGSSFDNTEDLNPEMENFTDLNNVLDEAGLWDDGKTDVSIGEDVNSTLFEDIDLADYEQEEIPEPGDDLIGESYDVAEKTIVSSEDHDPSEESIWEMDKQSDTDDVELESESVEEQISVDENQIEPADDFSDEVDDIPLEVEDESLEELFSEGGLQDEAVDEEPDGSPEQTTDDQDHSEASDGLLDEIDDIPLDGETLEELLSENESGDEGSTDEFQPESKQEKFLTDGEEIEVTDDSPDAVMDDTFKDIETEEITTPDESKAERDVSETFTQQPLISEEKVEEMVRTVVGEVVERIAREVFTEIAEKVITEAIDSLKKSLDSDSE